MWPSLWTYMSIYILYAHLFRMFYLRVFGVVCACYYSLDAKQPFQGKACFSVIMKFFGWFIISELSWIRISQVPDSHPWGIFLRGEKQNGHHRLSINSVLGYIFTSNALTNTILVSTPIFSWSRNLIMIKLKVYIKDLSHIFKMATILIWKMAILQFHWSLRVRNWIWWTLKY